MTRIVFCTAVLLPIKPAPSDALRLPSGERQEAEPETALQVITRLRGYAAYASFAERESA
jgi:hypothetical protein